ncbi:MAG TPA: hypothetical protein VGD98_02390 [Ktedonobacteraceae bacterium]
MHEKFAPDLSEQTGRPVNCPYCGSSSTELFSLFGQQLLTLQYYCNTCHTPFEHIKDDDVRATQTATRADKRQSSQ